MPFEARTREQELLARIGPLYREAAAANVAPKAQLDVEQTMLRRACMDYVLSRNRLLDDIWRVLDAPAGNPREPLVRNILATLAPLAKRGFSHNLEVFSLSAAGSDASVRRGKSPCQGVSVLPETYVHRVVRFVSGGRPPDCPAAARQASSRIRQISSQCPAIVRLVSRRYRSSIPPVSDGIAHRYPVLG